ncbi:MAG TPA: DUF4430 domain-containing protein [Solirubrobacterales bacterium]|jgi:hypothetical protein
MRIRIAALCVASLISVALAPVARAAPTQVNVRIEGKSETLFEGPILTDGHNVRASSDSSAPAGGRRCNGLNNGKNPSPGPTPTAAGVDAMSLIGEDFDGLWYAEPFEDYFIKRWGPDAQNEGAGEYWGLVVNNVFTSVGGCQYQLDGGDEVLWVYDAFSGRPRLLLYPPGYSGAAVPGPVTVNLNEPLTLEVDAWSGYNEGDPPPAPTRSTTPYEGAEVAPVATDGQGFERVETDSPEAVTSGADGKAAITFAQTGWHRIKATAVDSGGEETVVRSNRLDVCVLPDPSCATPPPEDLVRTPTESGEEESGGEGGSGETGGSGVTPPVDAVPRTATGSPAGSSDSSAAPVRLRLSRLDRSRLSRGLVGVSWQVLDAGPGIKSWSVSSQVLGRPGARYVRRAGGNGRSAAVIHLPPGSAYRLRLTVVDALGRSSAIVIGRVEVPL